MKVIILAGGLGTRLAEETETRPKPMVEIGGKAIHALCKGQHKCSTWIAFCQRKSPTFGYDTWFKADSPTDDQSVFK